MKLNHIPKPDYELIALISFRAAFVMTENKMTREARALINTLPPDVYDFAIKINESNHTTKTAHLIRYVFRAIEVNPDKNWFDDMKRMRGKLVQVDWEEFIRLYEIYRRKPYNKCPCQPLPLFPC